MHYNYLKNKIENLNNKLDKLAVSGSDRDLNWQEFEELVNKYIIIYRDIRIPQGHPLIIYGHKEACFPVAILAAILLNIPYVPIDTVMPSDRLLEITKETNSQVVVITGKYEVSKLIPTIIGENLNIIENSKVIFGDNIYGNVKKDPIRYIMFTSGSTGKPKGVQITKRSLISFVDWIKSDYDFSTDDVFFNQAPFNFDLSHYDLTFFLMFGASYILTSNEIMKNLEFFYERLNKYKCTVWTSTPSFIYQYLRDSNFNSTNFPYLKKFLFIGETFAPQIAKTIIQKFPNAKIYNAYGPTEATVATSIIEINQEIIEQYPSLPIGYPKKDSEIIIDNPDKDGNGELIIVGDHVSTGYFNDKKLTSEKFFVYKNKPAFRTGDYGYYKDNILFFIGRKDEQVKLHGYRIELEEISSKICKNSYIEDAITIPLKRGTEVKRIISFVKYKTSMNIPVNSIKLLEEDLKEKLPYYMIPADILEIDEFPYNNNHKIDKKQLIERYLKRS